MNLKLASLLIASLGATAAVAQPSSTTKMPDSNSAVVTPAGAAQGRAPTAINTPQQGSGAKATPVPGSTLGNKEEKVVNTKPRQVQGSTSTAAQAAIEHPGAHSSTGKSAHDKKDSRDRKEAAPAVVLTTPAPGPVNTTPNPVPNRGPASNAAR